MDGIFPFLLNSDCTEKLVSSFRRSLSVAFVVL